MSSLASLVDTFETHAYVTSVGFLGGKAAISLGNGTVVLIENRDQHIISTHPDASILVASCDGSRLVTGGDDGRVVLTSPDGSVEAVFASKKWIDAVALHSSGGIAWSSGRDVSARDAKGQHKHWQANSTVRGLCFAPKGYQLAMAHYEGASLWYPNLDKPPQKLEWKGSHIDVTWSKNGRFLVTSMQENALHGWRLDAPAHMRMSGYPGKCRSFSWSHDGDWLASSGAEAAIIWPFASKEGPTGKAPRECGVRSSKVSQVAFHPKNLVLAIGYEDGFVMLVRFQDGAELLVQQAQGSPVTAMAWDDKGAHLVFGCANGKAGILALP